MKTKIYNLLTRVESNTITILNQRGDKSMVFDTVDFVNWFNWSNITPSTIDWHLKDTNLTFIFMNCIYAMVEEDIKLFKNRGGM